MKKPRKKPTGDNGWVKFSAGRGWATAEFVKLQLPETKEGVEQFVIDTFLPEAVRQREFPAGCRAIKNKEDALDFTLDFGDGTHREIDLMEVANLRGPYSTALPTYNQYDFAKHEINKIHGKSKKYGPQKDSPIYLLMYVTDWRLQPGRTTMALLQYWAFNRPHNFHAIYLWFALDQSSVIVDRIYPTPAEHWVGFNPEDHRNNTVINLDPQKWETIRRKQ